MNGLRRRVLGDVAELLVPAGDGMPSARDIALAHSGLDRVLQACPELEAPLAAALDRLHGLDPPEALAALEGRREELELVAFVVVGAYVTEPAVASRLGYRGRIATPLADDLDDEVLELLAPVVERRWAHTLVEER